MKPHWASPGGRDMALLARSSFHGHPGLYRFAGHFPGPISSRRPLQLSQFIAHFPGLQHRRYPSPRGLMLALRASLGSGKTWRDHPFTSYPPRRTNEPPCPAIHSARPLPSMRALRVHPDSLRPYQTPRRQRHSAQPNTRPHTTAGRSTSASRPNNPYSKGPVHPETRPVDPGSRGKQGTEIRG